MNQQELRKEAAEKKYPMLKTMPNSAKITVANQRAAFKEGAEWEAEREKWISVADALPEERKDVLVSFDRGNGKPQVAFDYFTEGFFYRHHGVTHWQYITPPKTSKQ